MFRDATARRENLGCRFRLGRVETHTRDYHCDHEEQEAWLAESLKPVAKLAMASHTIPYHTIGILSSRDWFALKHWGHDRALGLYNWVPANWQRGQLRKPLDVTWHPARANERSPQEPRKPRTGGWGTFRRASDSRSTSTGPEHIAPGRVYCSGRLTIIGPRPNPFGCQSPPRAQRSWTRT